MKKIIFCLRLMRVKHWIKNIFVFVPLFFSLKLFDLTSVLQSINAFIIFSLCSSLVYIINDICDRKKDQNHPRKKSRPIPNKDISITEAIKLILLLLVLLIVDIYYSNKLTVVYVGMYFFINLLYSFKLKQYPIIDVIIIACGFLLRVLVGGSAINVEISHWLILTICSLAMFLGFGKRRNELLSVNTMGTRKVLHAYNVKSLDNYLNIFTGIFLVFYSLYVDQSSFKFIWLTLPLVFYGVLRYHLILHNKDIEGDPTEILFKDRGIQVVSLLYGVMIIGVLYVK